MATALRRLTLTFGSSRSVGFGDDAPAADGDDVRLLPLVRELVSDWSRGVVSETVAWRDDASSLSAERPAIWAVDVAVQWRCRR